MVHIPGKRFSDFQIFKILMVNKFKGVNIPIPNFVAIRRTFDEMWRFFDFSGCFLDF